MATTNEYLNQLQKDKQNLVDNLNTMGVESYDNETFTDLAPKVLEVKGKLQTKTAKASESSDVIVNPDTGFDGMSQVTVSKIVASDINNLEAENIKRGTTILDIEGTYGPTSQVKNATPSTSAQVIVPDEGIEFMSAVNLAAVTSAIDSDIKSENIKSGVDILGVMGTFAGDINIQENKDIIPTTSQQEILADEGFNAMAKVTVNAVDSSIDGNITPSNIRKGVSILSVEGSYEPEPTQEKTVSASISDVIVTPDDGFGGLSKVTVNAVTSSIDSDIKPENIKTGVNILGVSGNLPEFIPESILINPTTEQQTITPTPGKTAITNITVNAVTNSIDSNITSDNIRINKEILGVTGTFVGDNVQLQEKSVSPSSSEQVITADTEYDALSKVTVLPIETAEITITPKTTEQVIDRTGELPLNKVTVSKVTSTIDSNIQPENIKQNMSILGVVGTYTGDVQTYFGPLSEGDNYTPGVLNSILKIPDNIAISGTSGDYMFYQCANLTTLPVLDYSRLTSAIYMFGSTGISDFSNLNMPYIKKASRIFDDCNIVNGNFNCFPALTDASYLFYGSILSTNEVNVTFNQNITNSAGAFGFLGNNSATVNIKTNQDKIITVVGDSMLGLVNSYQTPGLNKCYISENIHLTSMEYFAGKTSHRTGASYLEVDISYTDSLANAFYARAFKEIKFLGSAEKLINVSNIFSQSGTFFTTFNGISNLGKAYTQQTANYANYTLDLSKSTGLTHDSLMNVINGLYDLNLTYNVAGGGTLYTQQLVLGETNLAKLTEDEIAIATNKGWTVS